MRCFTQLLVLVFLRYGKGAGDAGRANTEGGGAALVCWCLVFRKALLATRGLKIASVMFPTGEPQVRRVAEGAAGKLCHHPGGRNTTGASSFFPLQFRLQYSKFSWVWGPIEMPILCLCLCFPSHDRPFTRAAAILLQSSTDRVEIYALPYVKAR